MTESLKPEPVTADSRDMSITEIHTSFGPRFLVFDADGERRSDRPHATRTDAEEWADYLTEVTR